MLPQVGRWSKGADRLEKAIGLNRRAALRSASWDIGKIMSFNASSAGFQDVEAMVAAMLESEDHQFIAMGQFLKKKGSTGRFSLMIGQALPTGTMARTSRRTIMTKVASRLCSVQYSAARPQRSRRTMPTPRLI